MKKNVLFYLLNLNRKRCKYLCEEAIGSQTFSPVLNEHVACHSLCFHDVTLGHLKYYQQKTFCQMNCSSFTYLKNMDTCHMDKTNNPLISVHLNVIQ